MTHEFEGHSEKEAIDKAVKELGLKPEQDFDVEILESRKGGFLRRGYVRLRIHTGKEPAAKQPARENADWDAPKRGGARRGGSGGGRRRGPDRQPGPLRELEPEGEAETALVEFGNKTLRLMGYEDARVAVVHRRGRNRGFTLISKDSPTLIGRKGNMLDAFQILFSNYAMRVTGESFFIFVDCENYRRRREYSLSRLAFSAAHRVRQTRTSVLLDPMNPFERRLVHTALSGQDDVETKSEGNGLIKRVRIFLKGEKDTEAQP